MDGSSLTTFVSGLSWPVGTAIDYSLQMLYWAELGNHRIRHSSLAGGQVITMNHSTNGPWGLVLADRRLYWSPQEEGRVSSSSVFGGEIRIMYNGSARITHLAAQDSAVARRNPCRDQACDGLCVLTPSSVKCLALIDPLMLQVPQLEQLRESLDQPIKSTKFFMCPTPDG